MTEKLKIRQAVVVEGKYDKIKLSSILDACILTTEGFGLFKDEDKKALFRRLAAERGLIVASDADGAGLVIRNYFNSIIPKDRLFHVYIPEIAGKEKRKASPSKEGTLGLEGMEAALRRALFLPFAENREGSDGNRNDASKEAAAEAAGGIRSASAEQAVSEAQSVSAGKADPAGRESIGNDRGCAVSASPEGRGGKKASLPIGTGTKESRRPIGTGTKKSRRPTGTGTKKSRWPTFTRTDSGEGKTVKNAGRRCFGQPPFPPISRPRRWSAR